MAQFPTDDEVFKAVDDAGWLLEQQAARTLDKRGFATRPSWAFRDLDEPSTSRELDVWAYKPFYYDETSKLDVSAEVLVECKQSDKPYCAIGQKLPHYRKMGNPTEHTLPAKYVARSFDAETNRLEFDYAWDVLGFRELVLKHGLSDFRATQLTRLDRKGNDWSASNAGIFPSITHPLAKAVRASQPSAEDTIKSWHPPSAFHGMAPPPRRFQVSYTLRFPVILISSPLYVIDASSEQPSLEHARWVRLQRHLETEKLRGLFEFDVVTRDHFDEYIGTVVEGFAGAVASTVETDPLRYTGEEGWPAGIPEDGSFITVYAPQDFS